MIVTHTIADCRGERAKLGEMVLVPTMGALHAGHLELITIARQHGKHVAVSIFVNPTQFGPGEDFSRYPRPLEEDLEMCRGAGVDLVFNPSAKEMYPDSSSAAIALDLPQLTSVLDGKSRPGHFQGVCEVVAKLFNITQPRAACFGQKDYQQLRILSAMVEKLNWPIKIIACPTKRDADGMAISSRNRYLSREERERGLSISRGLAAAEKQFKAGTREAQRLVSVVENILADGKIPLSVDYVALVDALTLQRVEAVISPAVLAVAAKVGATRLIDNVILNP
jgi:pantoate--beta-alanine ligase